MRVFWGCVALLVAIGVWFILQPGGGTTQSRVTSPRELADSPAAAASDTHEDSRPGDATIGDGSKTPPDQQAPQTHPPQPSETANVEEIAPALPEIDLLGESGVVVIPRAAPRTLRTDDRRPSDIVRRLDERTLELDGRFRLTGNGSDADPYLITWEMLTSASEYVDPAQNARTPPPWVRLLDGTYVEISGYYSTAVRVALAKNLLLTLNRWDGCCIGVPPTAFDAIDITMRDPLPMRGLHLTRFGTFKGLFRAECLDAAGFLIGLYRLEDATFETK